MELLTKNKAMETLKIGRVRLEHLLKSGSLECVKIGNAYLIPDWSLEQCLKNTTKHPLSLSSEVKPTISKYQPSSTEKEYSFAKQRIQRLKQRLNSTQH